MIASFGFSLSYATVTPSFSHPDEQAHLAYAHAIAAGHLPRIEDVPSIPEEAARWADQSNRSDARHQVTWVANHPPLFYVVCSPLIWLSNWLDRSDGGLLFLRVANAGFAALGLVFVYLIGVQVSGDRQIIPLTATAIVALLPRTHGLFGYALNDGLAMSAALAMVWAAITVVSCGPTRSNLLALGAATAVAAGTRTAVMLLGAGVVVGAAVLVGVGQTGHRRDPAIAARIVALGLGPAVGLWGWFYVRNLIIYGDIAGSAELLDRFDRAPAGSALGTASSAELWLDLYRTLASGTSDLALFVGGASPTAQRISDLVGIAVLIGLAIAIGRRAIALRPAIVMVVAVIVTLATVIQHVSGGGSAFSRYLFPVLGLLAVLASIGAHRVLPVAGPVALVALLAVRAFLVRPSEVPPILLLQERTPALRASGGAASIRALAAAAPWLGMAMFAVGWAVGGILTYFRAHQRYRIDTELG